MAISKPNFQYIGYLGDFLTIYHNIDVLSKEFECAKYNYDKAKEKLDEYNNRFSMPNCIVACAFLFAILFVINIPFILFLRANAAFIFAFCAILSCVIIFMNKVLYTKRVLPKHRSTLQDEVNRAKDTYEKAYNALITERSNLRDMIEGLDENCTYPLPIYIMREAAKEGSCVNIPQGVKYFNGRYQALSESSEESLIKLKERIDKERASSIAQKDFLDNLDEKAKTLFEK